VEHADFHGFFLILPQRFFECYVETLRLLNATVGRRKTASQHRREMTGHDGRGVGGKDATERGRTRQARSGGLFFSFCTERAPRKLKPGVNNFLQ
jgi:hypothetical protein